MDAHASTAFRVLFRVAAGPRIGSGHLVRATVLARAMGKPAIVSLRGTPAARATAARMGCRLVDGAARELVNKTRPDVVVIDDPSGAAATAWCRAVRSTGVPVVSVHDLAIGYCGADLTIDGSVCRPAGPPDGRALLGPRYAILGPQPAHTVRRRRSVLIAVGGGPRPAAALALARAVLAVCPDVTVRIAAGHSPDGAGPATPGVVWLGPQPGLGRELARASAAVVGGGVTLYETCRDGTPAVAVAVVQAQQPTVRAIVAAGAALDGGRPAASARVALHVARLLEDAALCHRLGRAGRALVDGRGADRVSRAINALVRARGRSTSGCRP